MQRRLTALIGLLALAACNDAPQQPSQQPATPCVAGSPGCSSGSTGDAKPGKGELCGGVATPACLAASCGDGVVDPWEACDDGNTSGADGCSATCALSPCADCTPAAAHVASYPTRVAVGPDGRLYVTDAKLGSVLVYNESLMLTGELPGVEKPLGIAVADDGTVYVGSDQNDSVVALDSHGAVQRTIGAGTLRKPSSLALDRAGSLYVADSLSNVVKVYTTQGDWVRDIPGPGALDGGLDFPVAVAIAYGLDADAPGAAQLFVADQGHRAIRVFDTDGTFLRTLGGEAEDDAWQGRFIRIQALAFDSKLRLHALDSYMNKVQVLDALTGEYLDSYGEAGTSQGKLNLPLDIAIPSGGHVVVANAKSRRVEVIHVVE